MNPTLLANLCHLPSSDAKKIEHVFVQPDSYIDMLIQRAARQQWHSREMNWQAIDLSSLPRSLRQAAANMFAQLHYGEITAYLGSARMSEAVNRSSARDFFISQTADEARHIEWFDSLIAKLGCEAQVLPSVQHLMDDVYNCDSIEEMVIGMHIIIEGMAHSFFLEGTAAFAKIGILRSVLGAAYQHAEIIFNHWLPNFLGRDEGRHLAFGIHFMRDRLKQMSCTKRDQLEAKTRQWAELYCRAAGDPMMLAVPGLNSKEVLRRTTDRINQHLQAIGLESRIHAH
jgi:hypothetical protein